MADQKPFDSYLTDDNLLFIENDYIRIGANLSLGGALTYLAEKGKKNMINSFDWGRQVQMSFYNHPIPFVPEGHEMADRWKHIGWNPIQSGDVYRNRSRLVDYRCENNEIYVKCIPMHWPLDNCEGECTFEVWYRLDGYCVNVTSRLNNARPDKTQYEARWQELPAVYTNGEWYKGVSYVGKKPFTGDELTEIVTKYDKRGYPWLQFYPTENWSALVDDNNYGLGIYIPTTSFSKIGFWLEDKKGYGEVRDRQTGYVAPFAPEVLDHNIVYTYEYSLIVGQVDFIRQTANEMDKSNDRCHFNFEHDRDHFYYKNITDKGFPTGGCLDFDFVKDSELKSPPQFFDPKVCKALLVDAAFDGEIKGEVVFTLYEGLDDRGWGKTAEAAVPFEIRGNGDRTLHKIDISMAPDCYVGFAFRFKSAGHLKLYGIEIC